MSFASVLIVPFGRCVLCSILLEKSFANYYAGHGRSVAVVCALLVAIGSAEDWKNAEEMIRGRRPCIRMNALHRKNLAEWSKNRLSSKRNEDVDVSSVILSDATDNLRQKRSINKS